jgi:hypothetical protein
MESGAAEHRRKSVGGGQFYTSGKVPLEKTLEKKDVSYCKAHDTSFHCADCREFDLHQETGFSACTVTNNHEFSARLSNTLDEAIPKYSPAYLGHSGLCF